MKPTYKDSYKNRMKQSNETKEGGFTGKKYFDVSKLDDSKEIMYKVKKGKNLIDIIPFTLTTNNSQRAKKGEIDYLIDAYVHRMVGPSRDDFLCLKKMYNKPCPICEHIEELKAQGHSYEDYKELMPKRRVLYNVRDLVEEDKKIYIFETSHFKMELELQKEAETNSDGELLCFFAHDEGNSIKFRGYEETYKKKTFMDIQNVNLVEREKQYKETIIDKAYSLDSLLVIPEYDEIKTAFYSAPVSDDDDDTEDAEEIKRKSKSNKKNDTEDEEDDEEAPKKKAKANTKKNKECPEGFIYGKDCDEHPECEDCELWDDCSEEYKKLKKTKAIEEEEDEDEDDEE